MSCKVSYWFVFVSLKQTKSEKLVIPIKPGKWKLERQLNNVSETGDKVTDEAVKEIISGTWTIFNLCNANFQFCITEVHHSFSKPHIRHNLKINCSYDGFHYYTLEMADAFCHI